MKRLNSLCRGAISAIALYFVGALISAIPYTNISGLLYEFFLYMLVAIGVLIVFVSTLYRQERFYSGLATALFSGSFYVLLFAINGSLGVTRSIYKLFGIGQTAVEDNVSGMLFLSYTFILCIAGLVSFIVGLIKVLIHNNRNKHILQ